MSHEILLVAGASDEMSRTLRVEVLNQAAASVPGVVSWDVAQSPTAAAALVETAPAGGSFAQLAPAGSGQRITVASSQRGLAAAEGVSAEYGAEAGHVTVLLGPDSSVECATDGVGFIPAFWARHRGQFLFSTHLASLVSLGLPPDVDEQGLVEYLTMLHPMQDRTLLQNATLLAAGATVRWREPNVSVMQRPLFVPSSESLSDDAVLATFTDVWPRIIDDAFEGPGRTSLGLSGGLDSRAIAEAAVGRSHHPITYTYGVEPAREAVVGARVARVLRLPHLAVPVSNERLLPDALASTQLLDGAHSPSEMYELWFADLLRRFTDSIVNGLAGGPLWGDDKALGLADPAEVLARQFKRYVPEVRSVKPLLSDDLAADAEDTIHRSLSDSLGVWDLSARPDMVIYWKIANRQLRWGNMLVNALRRAGLHTQAPFLDSRFLALASRLTPAQRTNGNLYLRVHREVFPRTASIRRSDDGNAPRALDHVYWSGESSYGQQLANLITHHPVSGVRRGLHLSGRALLSRPDLPPALRRVADREAERGSVFPADQWVRSSRRYADRLAALLEIDCTSDLLSSRAVAEAASGLRSGRPTIPALTLGKVGAARAWLADYDRRAEAFARIEYSHD